MEASATSAPSTGKSVCKAAKTLALSVPYKTAAVSAVGSDATTGYFVVVGVGVYTRRVGAAVEGAGAAVAGAKVNGAGVVVIVVVGLAVVGGSVVVVAAEGARVAAILGAAVSFLIVGDSVGNVGSDVGGVRLRAVGATDGEVVLLVLSVATGLARGALVGAMTGTEALEEEGAAVVRLMDVGAVGPLPVVTLVFVLPSSRLLLLEFWFFSLLLFSITLQGTMAATAATPNNATKNSPCRRRRRVTEAFFG